jgi:hypothetical protein
VRHRRDQPGDDTADRHAEVHRQTLERERGRAAFRRRQPGEEGGLSRPERAAADAPQHVDRKRLPRRADQRHQCERDRHHGERDEQDTLRADAVGERAADEAARERGRRLRGRREPGEAERDPAHVVEVDDQEREDDPVPERVQQAPELQDVDVVRQARVEAADVGAHRSRA